MQSVIVSLHASCWHFLAAITLGTLPSLCNVRINLHKHLKAVIPPLDCFFPSISKRYTARFLHLFKVLDISSSCFFYWKLLSELLNTLTRLVC